MPTAVANTEKMGIEDSMKKLKHDFVSVLSPVRGDAPEYGLEEDLGLPGVADVRVQAGGEVQKDATVSSIWQ